MLQRNSRTRAIGVADPRLIVVHEEIPGARVVHVFSDVDFSTAAEFEAQLASAFSAQPIIVNLLDCHYIDSSAVAVLVAVQKQLGTDLRVVIPPYGGVRRMFDLLQLSRTMIVAPSVERALKYSLRSA